MPFQYGHLGGCFGQVSGHDLDPAIEGGGVAT